MPFFPVYMLTLSKRDLYSITAIDFPHHLKDDDEKLIEGQFFV